MHHFLTFNARVDIVGTNAIRILLRALHMTRAGLLWVLEIPNLPFRIELLELRFHEGRHSLGIGGIWPGKFTPWHAREVEKA